MKLAVITDSSADIASSYLEHADLYRLEIPISIDGIDYEPSKLSHEEWYQLMRAGQDVPKTAQPSVAVLSELLKDLQSKGYSHVIGLFLSSGISGFYQNIFYLQDEFPEMEIKFPDSLITSSPLGYMAERALDMAEEGKSFDEVLDFLNYQIENDNAFMLVDDLHWLAKGGRLSKGGEILGSLLNIKPILQFSEDGKVEVYDKVRTQKKSMAELKKLLLQFGDKEKHKIFVIHAEADEQAQELYDYALEQGFPDVEMFTFGPVIVTHLGLGALAYAMSPKK